FLGMFGGDYEEHMIEADIAKLEQYYRSFGFHDVRVTRELRWQEDLRHVDVIFHIEEGQRYRVASVQVDGPNPLEQ
ncbi:MAG TPA: POTRA domain-containing protein, partial [Gemmataceae bacterium]|nr:POTRA domain-containing protein [Gemmataceae bacterium]